MSLSARHWITAFLLLVPLITGAVIAGATHLDPARAWSSGDEPSAAPAAGLPASELVDARRAAGEAGAQAGFLTTGTGELVEGISGMREQATGMPGQYDEAVTGAQQLHRGLVELQAGVGQLGRGATEVADGVGGAVDQVITFGALRGQVIEAIDRTVNALEGTDDPVIVDARARLLELRGQVELLELNPVIADQLRALKDGSREIANQLHVPGYAFHDGIYSATRGAEELSAGLAGGRAGIDEALTGVDQLDEGARRIDDMATRTKDRITAVQRAIPAGVVADGEGATASATSLAPTHALLIAAMVMLGGAFAGAMRNWWVLGVAVAGLAGVGVVLLWLLGSGVTGGALALAGTLLAAGVLAVGVTTRILLGLLGAVGGGAVAGGLGIGQIALVGWVWKMLSTSEVAPVWQVLADLTPLHWATAGLTALGNGGSGEVLWLASGVLAAMAVFGVAGALWTRQPVE